MINLSFNSFNKNEFNAIKQIFKTGNFTEGKVTEKFEKLLAQYFKRKYCVCVNSGTSANFLSMMSIKYRDLIKNNNTRKKEAVAISGICWPTTITAILDAGFELFLCDIDKTNLNLDINYLNRYKPKNLKYVISTPIMGKAKGTDLVNKYCKDNHLTLIEDSCESFGSSIDGSKIGSFGLMSNFSFYFSHHLTTIEGGAILTDDKKIYEILRSLKSHGWSRNNNLLKHIKVNKISNKFDMRWNFIIPGYNLRTTDMNSAIGIVQLKKINYFIKKRIQIAQNRLNKIKNTNITIFKNDLNEINSWMGFPIIIKNKKLKAKLINKLNKMQIDSRPLIAGNIQNHYVYRFYNQKNIRDLKNCNEYMDLGMVLPIHPFIDKKYEDELIKELNDLK
jgi:CDP-4-dehydro-6-deoxyglucose reductase, E1